MIYINIFMIISGVQRVQTDMNITLSGDRILILRSGLLILMMAILIHQIMEITQKVKMALQMTLQMILLMEVWIRETFSKTQLQKHINVLHLLDCSFVI